MDHIGEEARAATQLAATAVRLERAIDERVAQQVVDLMEKVDTSYRAALAKVGMPDPPQPSCGRNDRACRLSCTLRNLPSSDGVMALGAWSACELCNGGDEGQSGPCVSSEAFVQAFGVQTARFWSPARAFYRNRQAISESCLESPRAAALSVYRASIAEMEDMERLFSYDSLKESYSVGVAKLVHGGILDILCMEVAAAIFLIGPVSAGEIRKIIPAEKRALHDAINSLESEGAVFRFGNGRLKASLYLPTMGLVSRISSQC